MIIIHKKKRKMWIVHALLLKKEKITLKTIIRVGIGETTCLALIIRKALSSLKLPMITKGMI
jgi:hypothetical protein